MIIDKKNTLGTDQAVTVSAGTTDYIDLGVARDIGMSCGPVLCLTVTEAATASGAATVQFALQCDDNSSFSSPKAPIMTDAIPKATLVVGYQIFLPIPPGLDERYVRGYFTVATGPLTAGKFTTQFVHAIQKSKAYADALPAV